MSVTTTFDKKIIKVREGLDEIIKNLQDSLDKDIWGYSDMNYEYIDRLYEILGDLVKMKRKI